MAGAGQHMVLFLDLFFYYTLHTINRVSMKGFTRCFERRGPDSEVVSVYHPF